MEVLNIIIQIMIMGISVCAYYLSMQPSENHGVINVAALTCTYMSMMYLILAVTQLMDIDITFNRYHVFVNERFLEVWCMGLCYLGVKKKFTYKTLERFVSVGFVMTIFTGHLYRLFKVDYNQFNEIVLVSVVSIMLYVIILLRHIVYSNKLKDHQWSVRYFSLLLVCEIIFHVGILGYWSGVLTERSAALLLIPYIAQRVLFLAIAYELYWNAPWRQKMRALSEAEECIEDNAQHRTMVVNLSHELKTPINVINSAVDLLLLDYGEGSSHEACTEPIKNIRNQCNRTMRLVHNMIDIHKIRGQHMRPKYGWCNLVEVIENVIDVFVEEDPLMNITFNPEEEEIYNWNDSAMIQRLCMFLLYVFAKTRTKEHEIYMTLQRVSDGYIEMQINQPYIPALEDYIKLDAEVGIDPIELVASMQILNYGLDFNASKLEIINTIEEGCQIRAVVEECVKPSGLLVRDEIDDIEVTRGIIKTLYVLD